MKIRIEIYELLHNCEGYFYLYPITLTLILILTIFNSCTKEENTANLEAYVTDAISSEKLYNAEVQILEWHNIFEGQYSTLKEKVYTDANGHFIANYHSNPKYNYSLYISKDLYFDDDFPLPLPNNNVNLIKFPYGFIKTHVVNKIDTARWIDFYFTPYFYSRSIFRQGFTNCQLFTRAFADTTFITTTIGGVTNNLKILINYTDYIPDARVVKDTSFLTIKHDTVHMNIILF